MGEIAIPVKNGDVCDHFEDLQYFLVYQVDKPSIIKKDILYPKSKKPGAITEYLMEHGISEVIVRGISYDTIRQLNYYKIHVFVGVRDKKPENLIMDYLNNKLDTDERMCY